MELNFMNVSDVQKLVDIVEKQKLDYLKVGEIEIRKSIHLNPIEDVKKALNNNADVDDDLFYSSGPASNIKINV